MNEANDLENRTQANRKSKPKSSDDHNFLMLSANRILCNKYQIDAS